MRATSRMVALALITAVLAGGPLAPLARAQQPQVPAAGEENDGTATEETREAYEKGAIAADILYVPGKALLCGIGVGFGVFLMVITLGSAYRSASGAAREGCAGTWTLKPEDLQARKPVSQAFDWETHRFEWETK